MAVVVDRASGVEIVVENSPRYGHNLLRFLLC